METDNKTILDVINNAIRSYGIIGFNSNCVFKKTFGVSDVKKNVESYLGREIDLNSLCDVKTEDAIWDVIDNEFCYDEDEEEEDTNDQDYYLDDGNDIDDGSSISQYGNESFVKGRRPIEHGNNDDVEGALGLSGVDNPETTDLSGNDYQDEMGEEDPLEESLSKSVIRLARKLK